MAYLGQKEACIFPPLSFLYFGTPLLSFSRTCTADIDSITTVPKAKPDKLAGRTRLRLYTSNFSYIYAKLRKQEFPPLLLKRNFPLFFFFFLPKLLSPTVQGAIGERFVISVPSFFFVLQFLGKGGRKEKHFLPSPLGVTQLTLFFFTFAAKATVLERQGLLLILRIHTLNVCIYHQVRISPR